jgi:hypothetical protein
MFIGRCVVISFSRFFNPLSHPFSDHQAIEKIKNYLREFGGSQSFLRIISGAKSAAEFKQWFAHFLPDLVYALLIEPPLRRLGEVPVFGVLPIAAGDAKCDTVIFQQVDLAALEGDKVGLEICEDIAAGKTTRYHPQGRVDKLNERVLVQEFSFINKKRQPIVVKVRPYVVLVPSEVRCYYGNVAVSQIFVPDELEYLSCDEAYFHSGIWCRYNANVVFSVDFLLPVVKDGAFDMGKRRAGGKSGWLGENYRLS